MLIESSLKYLVDVKFQILDKIYLTLSDLKTNPSFHSYEITSESSWKKIELKEYVTLVQIMQTMKKYARISKFLFVKINFHFQFHVPQTFLKFPHTCVYKYSIPN